MQYKRVAYAILLIFFLNVTLSHAATVNNDGFQINSSVRVRLNLLANDTGSNLQIGELGQPSHGTVANNYDGTVNYTSVAGYLGTDAFNYTLTENSLFYNETGHYYEFVVNPGVAWATANTSAALRTMNGMIGYLATIMSQGENDFVKSKLSGRGWMGASDAATNKVWRWVSGPENGQNFFNQSHDGSGCGTGGVTASGAYSNWDSGEPNDYPDGCANGENFGHFQTSGKWNDYSGTNPDIDGYVVEYGGMPADAPSYLVGNVTLTIIDGMPPSVNLSNPGSSYVNDSQYIVNLTFNASVADLVALSNCSLWHNASGTWMINQTQNITGNQNNTQFQLLDQRALRLKWTIGCTDTSGNIYFPANRTVVLNYTDSVAPAVTLSSPSAFYYNDSRLLVDIIFSASVTDAGGIANCTLWHNLSGSWLANSSQPVTGNANATSFLLSNLSNSTFRWNIACTDGWNNTAFAAGNRTVILNFTDIDGDSVGDGQDRLLWNQTNVSIEDDTLTNLTVDGLTPQDTYLFVHSLEFYDAGGLFLNVTHNFTAGIFDLSLVQLTVTDDYLLVNLSGQLIGTKTIHFTDNNFASLCVKDAEVSSIDSMSIDCNESDEMDFTPCLGNSTPTIIGNISCVEEGGVVRLYNLSFTAVRGTPVVQSSGSSGRRGCSPVWSCTQWSLCHGGVQTRDCVDTKCDWTAGGPEETRTCICVEDWHCDAWSSCSMHSQTRLCYDDNACGTHSQEPASSRACAPPPAENPPDQKPSVSESKIVADAILAPSTPENAPMPTIDKPKRPLHYVILSVVCISLGVWLIIASHRRRRRNPQ